jgi:hypothetical protein
VEFSFEEQIADLYARYRSTLAGMRDLSIRMEDASGKFESESEALKFAGGLQVLGREILRIEHVQILSELTEIRKMVEMHVPSIATQAKGLELVMEEPNRKDGLYVGTVMCLDRRAVLIQYKTRGAIELPFSWLAEGQAKPRMGDTVRMAFKDGILVTSVTVSSRNGREDERIKLSAGLNFSVDQKNRATD